MTAHAAAHPELDRERRGGFRWFVVLAMSGAALAVVHPVYDADAFWHMTWGRAAVQAGAQALPEPRELWALARSAHSPEWLWDVLTYVTYRAGGEFWLSLIPAFAAAALVLILAGLVSAAGPRTGTPARGLVMSCALLLSLSRVGLQPELMCMLLLPLFLWLTLRYRTARRRRSALLLALGLVALELVWAQLHASFLLAPFVFALTMVWELPEASRASRRQHLFVLAMLAAGSFSSAYGLDLARCLEHLTRADDQLVSWASFNPASHIYEPLFACLLLFGLAGALVSHDYRPRELGLALLGVVLCASAQHFLFAVPALLVPFALLGAERVFQLAEQTHKSLVCVLASALFLLGVSARVAHKLDAELGPLGRVGFAPNLVPRAALHVLRGLPAGTPVLYTPATGGAISFFSKGHVRGYADGRAPLYFDETDAAVSRDTYRRRAALAAAVQRHEARALVLERRLPACGYVPEGFVVAAVDSSSTTFVMRGDAEPVQYIAPCASDLLRPGACAHRRELLAEIDRVKQLGDEPFAQLLFAAERVFCAEQPYPIRVSETPARQALWAPVVQQLRARALLLRGATAQAFEVLAPALAAGDLHAFDLLAPTLLSSTLPAARLHTALEALARAQGDRTPGRVRAVLAAVCSVEGDAECVRLQGLRAAVSGESPKLARLALDWLIEHHPLARVRADARAFAAATSAPSNPPAHHDAEVQTSAAPPPQALPAAPADAAPAASPASH